MTIFRGFHEIGKSPTISFVVCVRSSVQAGGKTGRIFVKTNIEDSSKIFLENSNFMKM
jgi:hypothetical protein